MRSLLTFPFDHSLTGPHSSYASTQRQVQGYPIWVAEKPGTRVHLSLVVLRHVRIYDTSALHCDLFDQRSRINVSAVHPPLPYALMTLQPSTGSLNPSNPRRRPAHRSTYSRPHPRSLREGEHDLSRDVPLWDDLSLHLDVRKVVWAPPLLWLHQRESPSNYTVPPIHHLLGRSQRHLLLRSWARTLSGGGIERFLGSPRYHLASDRTHHVGSCADRLRLGRPLRERSRTYGT